MTAGSGAWHMRRAARELVRSAADAGVEHPLRLLDCTPAEIEDEMRALQARREEQLAQLDLLAWLIGRYVMMGIHAPRRYPRRPDGVQKRPSNMTDAQMKQVFAVLAARRRDEVGSG